MCSGPTQSIGQGFVQLGMKKYWVIWYKASQRWSVYWTNVMKRCLGIQHQTTVSEDKRLNIRRFRSHNLLPKKHKHTQCVRLTRNEHAQYRSQSLKKAMRSRLYRKWSAASDPTISLGCTRSDLSRIVVSDTGMQELGVAKG